MPTKHSTVFSTKRKFWWKKTVINFTNQKKKVVPPICITGTNT